MLKGDDDGPASSEKVTEWLAVDMKEPKLDAAGGCGMGGVDFATRVL